ncbi:MAG TPA: hypothetical protein VE263_20975 [Candidatus Angelobacter sp.]|nr:hypothetical protein [Candidatus Angelobacter sp.]
MIVPPVLANPAQHLTERLGRRQTAQLRNLPALPFPTVAQYTRPQEKLIGAEATRRAPLMSLRELVRLYLQHAGTFGKPVALSAFGLSPAETERLFSGYDEDYHISRFFQFTKAEGQRFSISGSSATHVAIATEIETIL